MDAREADVADLSDGTVDPELPEAVLSSSAGKRDLVLLTVVVAVLFGLAQAFDLNELWIDWAAAHEDMEVDELPMAFSLAAWAFGWYAYRRWREYLRESAERKRTIGRLRSEIEARKKTETALIAAKDEANLANRSKSEFLANMSHELRTPLNAIIGFAGMMAAQSHGPIGDQRYRDYASDISDAAEHLLSVVNDILDLSKVEAGNTELDEAPVDLVATLRACLRLIAARKTAECVRLTTDFSATPKAVVYADGRMVKQILINLLSNATKFTPSGGEVTIRTLVGKHGGFEVRIADTGIGMAPEDIPLALSRFGQVDSGRNRHFGGFGLGLPITQALVKLHGGSLELQSEPGAGTTAIVRFPEKRNLRVADEALHLAAGI